MRDWLKASRPDLESGVNVPFRSSNDLAIARDIAKGGKHMVLTHLSAWPASRPATRGCSRLRPTTAIRRS